MLQPFINVNIKSSEVMVCPSVHAGWGGLWSRFKNLGNILHVSSEPIWTLGFQTAILKQFSEAIRRDPKSKKNWKSVLHSTLVLHSAMPTRSQLHFTRHKFFAEMGTLPYFFLKGVCQHLVVNPYCQRFITQL